MLCFSFIEASSSLFPKRSSNINAGQGRIPRVLDAAGVYEVDARRNFVSAGNPTTRGAFDLAVTIFLLRHAPHVGLGATLSGRTAGLSLSAKGAAQAIALGMRLAGETIDRIQASPLARTMETALAVAKPRNAAVEPIEALNEIDFGSWTGRAFADLDRDPAWDMWNRARSSAAAPGGESMAFAQARIVGHLQATARDHDGQTVTMVTHCDMIRGAVAWVLGLTLDHLLRFDIDPASVTRIVIGDWGGRILSLNEGTC